MQVIINRIERKIAVLEVQGGPIIELPVKFLPKGVKEGSVLNLYFEIDKLTEKERYHSIKNLQLKLKKRK